MVLEAAYEMADRDKKVKRNEYRDVKFDHRLVITDDYDQGVETSLEFQPPLEILLNSLMVQPLGLGVPVPGAILGSFVLISTKR